jgi:riboflavin-specific deaminase-like protein
VFVNMSLTADGKIATANRVISSFGSERDQTHLLELRTRADAVMCGARTADMNEINLGPGPLQYRRRRLRLGLAEHNVRVVVSGSGSLDPQAHLFQHRFSPIVILTTERAGRARRQRLAAVADVVRVCGRREIDWPGTLNWLRKTLGVQSLLCEGGGELNGALFQADLVDELHLTFCPLIFGGREAPTIAEGLGASRLADAARFRLVSRRTRGAELFAVYRRAGSTGRGGD